MKLNNFEYKIGNHKIGKDTLIFNMGSATHCPSKKLGLCMITNAGKKCYALKAEQQYKDCLPFRDRQAKYWKHSTQMRIAVDMYNAVLKHKNIKYVRFNESGDFENQFDVVKLKYIARNVARAMKERFNRKIIFYGYTARRDLHFGLAGDCPSLVLNGSGFYLNNRFVAVEEYTGQNPVCKGNCLGCMLCKQPAKNTIEIKYH